MIKKIIKLSVLCLCLFSVPSLAQAESSAESSQDSTVASEQVDISVQGLSYDTSTKILSGKTEPNADVFVISDNGQGTWKADENGNFSCDLQLVKVGDVLKISAGFNYKFGTPVEFTIPTDEKEASVWGLNYNQSNKTLYGETEANADVFVIGSDGQGTYKANEYGFFSCELQLAKVGDVLKVSAGFNDNFGTPVEFTIPTEGKK